MLYFVVGLEFELEILWLFFFVGVDHVLSTVVGREFALQETCREFVSRYRQKDVDKQALPMLASACPGCPRYIVDLFRLWYDIT